MRRIPRLQSLRAVAQPTTSAAPLRLFSTTRATPFRSTARRSADDKQQRQEVLEALERDRQSALRITEAEAAEAEAAAAAELALPETSIVVPPDFSYAPAAKDGPADYVPAKTAEGLEEVGGLEGWWDVEGNLGDADRLRVFSERAVGGKVTEPSVLEVLVRQAVVEGLVVQGKEGELLMGRWGAAVDKGAMVRAGGVAVKVAENGDVTLDGDLGAVLEGLKADAEEAVAQEAVPEIAEEGETEQVELAPEELLTAEEATEMIKSWDRTWRKIPLTDPSLKFAVCHHTNLPT